MTPEYELLKNATFPKAYESAQRNGLAIASFNDVLKLFKEKPQLTESGNLIATGTIAAMRKGPFGKSVSMTDKPFSYSKKTKITLQLQDYNFGGNDAYTGLIMALPEAYEFEQKEGGWIFSLKKGMMSSIAYHSIENSSNELQMRLKGPYVGPVFTGGLYGMRASITPSPSLMHNFLLVPKTLEEKVEETKLAEAPEPVKTGKKKGRPEKSKSPKEPEKTEQPKEPCRAEIVMKYGISAINEYMKNFKIVALIDHYGKDDPLKRYVDLFSEPNIAEHEGKAVIRYEQPECYEELKKKAKKSALSMVRKNSTRNFINLFFDTILREGLNQK